MSRAGSQGQPNTHEKSFWLQTHTRRRECRWRRRGWGWPPLSWRQAGGTRQRLPSAHGKAFGAFRPMLWRVDCLPSLHSNTGFIHAFPYFHSPKRMHVSPLYSTCSWSSKGWMVGRTLTRCGVLVCGFAGPSSTCRLAREAAAALSSASAPLR